MDFKVLILIVILGCAQAEDDGHGYVMQDERVLKYVLDGYNKDTRAAKAKGEKTTVDFGLAFIDIVEINEIKGTITAQTWVRQRWRDIRLQWNPADYDNVTSIRMPNRYVWIPDIVLYNSAKEGSNLFSYDSQVVVHHDGTCLWIPSINVKAKCSFDLTYFPFDQHVCQFKYGSWVYHGEQVDLGFYEGMKKMDFSDFNKHIQWTILNSTAKYNPKIYPCCPEIYPDITFNLTIERKSSHYQYVYLWPAVIFGLFMPVLFLVQHDERQRLVMGTGLLICVTLLLFNLEWIFYSISGSLPVLGSYYLFVHFLVCLSMVISAITANMKRGSSKPIPAWVDKIFLKGVGRFLCVKSGGSSTEAPAKKDGGKPSEAKPEEAPAPQSAPTGEKWVQLSLILDRLFFIIYLVISVICAMCFLIHPRSARDQDEILKEIMSRQD